MPFLWSTQSQKPYKLHPLRRLPAEKHFGELPPAPGLRAAVILPSRRRKAPEVQRLARKPALGFAILAFFLLITAAFWFIVSLYHESQGRVAHYRVISCVLSGDQSAQNLQNQGYQPSGYPPPTDARIRESIRSYHCFGKDYGLEVPERGNRNTRTEYRNRRTYYAEPGL